MLEFLQTGKALSVLAVIGCIGIISKLITRSLYKRLIKESENMAMTRNKNLKLLKQKLENTYRLNQNIVNTQAYLDKLMYGFRFMHLSLDTWNNLSLQMILLGILAGGVGSFLSYWYRLDTYYIVLYASAGALGGLFLAFLDSSFNIGLKQQKLETLLLEYVDNSVFVRAARENPAWEAAAARAGQVSVRAEQSFDRTGQTAAGAGQPTARMGQLAAGAGQASARNRKDSARMGQTYDDRDQFLRENEVKDGLVREETPRRSVIRSFRGRNSRADDLLRTVRNMKDEESADGDSMDQNNSGSEYRGADPRGMKNSDMSCGAESQARRDIDYLKQSLDQIAASRDKLRDAREQREQREGLRPGEVSDWTKSLSSEEAKLIGDIMREYFSGT